MVQQTLLYDDHLLEKAAKCIYGIGHMELLYDVPYVYERFRELPFVDGMLANNKGGHFSAYFRLFTTESSEWSGIMFYSSVGRFLVSVEKDKLDIPELFEEVEEVDEALGPLLNMAEHHKPEYDGLFMLGALLLIHIERVAIKTQRKYHTLKRYDPHEILSDHKEIEYPEIKLDAHISVKCSEPASDEVRRYIRHCEAWSVRGHYRRYKSGKVVYIKPHIKGNGAIKETKYKTEA